MSILRIVPTASTRTADIGNVALPSALTSATSRPREACALRAPSLGAVRMPSFSAIWLSGSETVAKVSSLASRVRQRPSGFCGLTATSAMPRSSRAGTRSCRRHVHPVPGQLHRLAAAQPTVFSVIRTPEKRASFGGLTGSQQSQSSGDARPSPTFSQFKSYGGAQADRIPVPPPTHPYSNAR
jgi:hypothetical protein